MAMFSPKVWFSWGKNKDIPEDTDEEDNFFDAEEFKGISISLEKKFNEAKVDSPSPLKKTSQNSVKIYIHSGGGASGSYKLVGFVPQPKFLQLGTGETDDEDEVEWRQNARAAGGEEKDWHVIIGDVIPSLYISNGLSTRFNDDKFRIDFVYNKKVWALKFPLASNYMSFVGRFKDCLFENTYHLEANEKNREKIFGKEWAKWMDGAEGDDEMWDAASDGDEPPLPRNAKEMKTRKTSGQTPQSLSLGIGARSFLIHESGIDVFKNQPEGMEEDAGNVLKWESNHKNKYLSPKKGLLVEREKSMLLMGPSDSVDFRSAGVLQLDLESEKVVRDWTFEKNGVNLKMTDIVHDSKGSQMEEGISTFLGLDKNTICRWDMRTPLGRAQDLTNPALEWNEGHEFSRSTNFTCMATTGDGCIAVGSKDGKIRLYSTTSMRQAKTSIPVFSGPVTHIDVTFDGRWIVGTSDSCLAVIGSMFKGKDGMETSGFKYRMGEKKPSLRLLKLNPEDAAMVGHELKMRAGQFSWVTEGGRQERNIVATLGRFSIIWNFRRVKQTNHECYQNEGLKICYCYKVVLKDQSVVDAKFMHDDFSFGNPDAPLIVATPGHVSSFNV